jgi:hypothetical protein
MSPVGVIAEHSPRRENLGKINTVEMLAEILSPRECSAILPSVVRMTMKHRKSRTLWGNRDSFTVEQAPQGTGECLTRDNN